MCPHTQIHSHRHAADHKIRCILAHDHLLLRQGLRRLLEDEPDIEIVAEAQDAAEALLQVFEHRPEIVIIEPRLFGSAADQAEQLVLRTYPNCRVLFLTANGAAPGGPACSVRDTSADELADMVRAAAPARTRGGRAEWGKKLPQKALLTERESEVLKLLAEGKTVRCAAGLLGLSVKTVDAHKFNLMRKLGVHNKAELVISAIQNGVVKLPASY